MLLISSLIASFLLATLPFSIANDIACEVPDSFTVGLSYDTRATISKIDLILQTEKDVLYMDTTPELDSLRIQSDKVFVIFKGELEFHNGRNNVTAGPSEVSELFYETLISEAERSISTPEEAETAWCRVGLLPSEPRRSIIHPWIAKEIILLAESCAQRAICSKIRLKYSGNEARSSVNKTTSETAPSNENSREEECASTELQKTLNMMVDMGLGGIIEKVKKESASGGIKLPEMAKYFDVGSGIFKTTGHISLWNGSFGDITTLRRRSDAVISHKGWKLTAACEVGLDRAEIEYKHYELQYAIKAKGTVTGFVDGVALAIQVSADYDQKPCVATLDHLKITRFGGIRVDMTGLGRPFEWLVSTLSDWFTTKFHKSITVALEAQIRGFVLSKLSSFNCEKFRAWN